MSETASCSKSCEKTHFFLRKLHSLTGIALSGFILEHFFTNSASLHAFSNVEKAASVFNSHVEFLHSIPGLPLVELALLAVPFLFHILYGFYITFATGRPNLGEYPTERNLAYVLQRISAVVITVFLVVHVLELRMGWNVLPRSAGAEVTRSTNDTPYKIETVVLRSTEGREATRNTVERHDYYAHVSHYMKNLSTVGVWLYVLGILATAYHFGNGIFLAGITWGLWIRRSTQQKAFVACMGIMVVLAAVGWASLMGFRS
ncbi:MAG: hypothetical protein AB7F75_02165 [Planctomycetota bacterium]